MTTPTSLICSNFNTSIYLRVDFSIEVGCSALECFHACVAGCGYKFDVPSQKVDQIHPSRPPPPPPKDKLTTRAVKRILPGEPSQTIDDIPGTSA
uniref:Uncharacterized protein n=1 Tax=Solanum lycopersicum TaxID=4081 RepID=A0A3Q7IBK5_SOLLC